MRLLDVWVRICTNAELFQYAYYAFTLYQHAF